MSRMIPVCAADVFQTYVRALDSGNPPLSDVAVMRFIVDNNRNRPTFTPTTKTININEDQTPGSVIGSCTATDADSQLPNMPVCFILVFIFFSFMMMFFQLKKEKNLINSEASTVSVVVNSVAVSFTSAG